MFGAEQLQDRRAVMTDRCTIVSLYVDPACISLPVHTVPLLVHIPSIKDDAIDFLQRYSNMNEPSLL